MGGRAEREVPRDLRGRLGFRPPPGHNLQPLRGSSPPATQRLARVQLKAGETVRTAPVGSKTMWDTPYSSKTSVSNTSCLDLPAFHGMDQRLPTVGGGASARARRGGRRLVHPGLRERDGDRAALVI